MTALRDLLPHAPHRHASSADICAWLEVTSSGPALVGDYTVVALAADTIGDFFFAVPNETIDATLRAALDEPWHTTFAIEEVTSAGQLWLLAYSGLGDTHTYAWLGPIVGADVASAHGAWSAYAIEPDALVGARVTHLYVARLAH